MIPSNSLAALYGLALDCAMRNVLGETSASGRVAGVALASGQRLKTDLVVCCLGRFTESLSITRAVMIVGQGALDPGSTAPL